MSRYEEFFSTWCLRLMRISTPDAQKVEWGLQNMMSRIDDVFTAWCPDWRGLKNVMSKKKKKMMRFTKPDVQSRRCFQNLISKTDDVFTTLCPGLMRFFKPNVEYIFKNWYPRLKGFWNSILLQVKHGASLYEKVIKKVSEAFRKRTAQENAIKELLRIKSCALIGRVVAYPLEKNHKTLTLRPAKRNVLV